jgi:S-adenosylmethionine hydrolase
MRWSILILLFTLFSGCARHTKKSNALVFQSDFGLKDGAVSAMKGVAFEVSPQLKMYDLTHEIPAYNIWEAAYRLYQTSTYWPAGTVFVSVVDPGVGSSRKSVVLRSKSGHYFVTPDNGTLTLIAEQLGIDAVREIDETKNRRKGSGDSYTFHGRDVYAYTGARLAAGVISFEEVGPELPAEVIRIPYQKPLYERSEIKGGIPILDIQYGNVWSNIDLETFKKLQTNFGDSLHVQVFRSDSLIWEEVLPYVKTFSAVPVGKDIAYLNSLLHFSLGINQENFSTRHRVFSGPEWKIVVRKKR